MISVAQALDALFALVSPLDVENVPLREAHGRVLARSVAAQRSQPPFAASAMDGYAVAAAQAAPGARFTVIGESAAGHRFDGTVAAGQAVRIFTGAP
ncbi:MAG: molybdopterin molybdenumtransferase MoeA, partial [Alphaproteobacteria bacterium]|nr:molybdopterin molybdenumtransferase MoeA [Alphaproteobacteria bacterium]